MDVHLYMALAVASGSKLGSVGIRMGSQVRSGYLNRRWLEMFALDTRIARCYLTGQAGKGVGKGANFKDMYLATALLQGRHHGPERGMTETFLTLGS